MGPYRTVTRVDDAESDDDGASDDGAVHLVLLLVALVPCLIALLSHRSWGAEPTLGLGVAAALAIKLVRDRLDRR